PPAFAGLIAGTMASALVTGWIESSTPRAQEAAIALDAKWASDVAVTAVCTAGTDRRHDRVQLDQQHELLDHRSRQPGRYGTVFDQSGRSEPAAADQSDDWSAVPSQQSHRSEQAGQPDEAGD